MFGFGSFSHLVVILVLALILIGPKQLPEVARTLGRLLTELRRASNIFTDEFRAQMRDEERKQQPMPPPPAMPAQMQDPYSHPHPHPENHILEAEVHPVETPTVTPAESSDVSNASVSSGSSDEKKS